MSEHWRQALHLEPPTGWLNDPNGLCWFGGRYHVYFQSCPDTPDGTGQKGWGHFTSTDLLRWDYTGTVLHPDTLYDKNGAYSGCAVVQKDGVELFYTGNVKLPGKHDYITSGRGANVLKVHSSDGVTMGDKQLLLQNADYPDFCSCHVRDPKIEPLSGGGWRMVLGARTLDDHGCVLVYHSADLTHWQYVKCLAAEQAFGYMWECPDLFTLGNINVLSVSPQGLPHEELRYQNVYQSGYFPLDDSLTPKADDFAEWDMGFDFYAPQTFLAPDGRRLMIGWMGLPDAPYQNATTALGWQHCLTFPREVFFDGERRLCQRPAAELAGLRGQPVGLADGQSVYAQLPSELSAQPQGNFCLTIAEGLRLTRCGTLCTLEFLSDSLGCGRTQRKAVLPRCRSLRVILDTSSVEAYLDDGACVFSARFYPQPGNVSLQLVGAACTVTPLRPMEVNYHGKT